MLSVDIGNSQNGGPAQEKKSGHINEGMVLNFGLNTF
jgi:hypothetical protein